MCHRARCERCGKPTWIGCGRHVERALACVPASERCACPRSWLASLLGLRARRDQAKHLPEDRPTSVRS